MAFAHVRYSKSTITRDSWNGRMKLTALKTKDGACNDTCGKIHMYHALVLKYDDPYPLTHPSFFESVHRLCNV